MRTSAIISDPVGSLERLYFIYSFSILPMVFSCHGSVLWACSRRGGDQTLFQRCPFRAVTPSRSKPKSPWPSGSGDWNRLRDSRNSRLNRTQVKPLARWCLRRKRTAELKRCSFAYFVNQLSKIGGHLA